MKSKLSNMLLGMAVMEGLNSMPIIPKPYTDKIKSLQPGTGNSNRTHDQNVKRRRLRRISKRSKQINRH